MAKRSRNRHEQAPLDVALHEAGHAVVGHYVGATVKSIKLTLNPEGTDWDGAVRFGGDEYLLEYKQWLFINVAGFVAESIAFPKAKRVSCFLNRLPESAANMIGDVAQALRNAATLVAMAEYEMKTELSRDEFAELRIQNILWAEKEVESILRQQWTLVETVAKAARSRIIRTVEFKRLTIANSAKSILGPLELRL